MAGEDLFRLLERKAPEEEVLKLVDAASAKAKSEKDGGLPLHWALQHKASDAVFKALLAAHPDAVKEKKSNGCVPLHLAAEYTASEAVVRTLLDAYLDAVKEKDNTGDLPLHMAAYGQTSDVVEVLLGAYPEATAEKNNDGKLPIHVAIQSKASDGVAALSGAYRKRAKEEEDLFQLLERRAPEEEVLELVDAASARTKEEEGGHLPLHHAVAYHKSERVFEALLAAHPDAVKVKDNAGDLPLHTAVSWKAPEAFVRALLKSYPDGTKEKGDDGMLPLHNAARYESSEAVIEELLKENLQASKEKANNGWLPLHYAARYKASEAVIAALLEANPETAKEETDKGELPLCVAARSKASGAVVAALLEANPEGAKEKDDDGRLPLHLAAQYEASEAVVAALLQAYSKAVKEKNVTGEMPLHLAARYKAAEAVVAALLEAHPEAVKEKNNVGLLPLHLAAQGQASKAVVETLLGAYSEGVKKRNDDGSLPLHLAAEFKASGAVVEALLGAYSKAVKEKNNDRKLPLHCAAIGQASKAVVAVLLGAYPEAAKKKTRWDDLPLHVAVENRASDAVVASLLGAYPEGVTEKGHEGNLPLHYAAAKQASEAVVVALLGAHTQGAKERNDKGKLPLRCSFENEASEDHMMAILAAYPDAAKERLDDGRLPLHVAVLGTNDKKSDVFISALVKAHPDGVKQRDPRGDLPLDSLLKSDMYKESIIHILELDMPVRLEDGSPVKHSYSWTKCLLSDKETAIEAVRHILDRERGGYSKHINKLIEVRAENGSPAIKVASPKQEAELNKHRLFCARYEFYSDALEHRSETSTVLRATDRMQKIDYRAVFDEEDKDNSKTLTKEELVSVAKRVGLSVELFTCKGESIDFGEFAGVCVRHLGDGYRRVVIKLMKNEEQWEREKSVRKDYGLDPEYVVGVSEKVPSDEQIRADVEALKGLGAVKEQLPDGIELGKYAIIMEAADRNLLQIYHQEGPDTNASRTILQQLLEAVKHMHEKGVEHGDLKFLNALRFGRDGKLRLTDLDASARIVKPGEEGESYTGSKFSSATLPPEMFFEVKTDDHRQQLKEYWRNGDKELRAKVAEKARKRRGKVTHSYVVKTFRMEDGEPVHDGLPYKPVETSEKGDIWALGVMAFELLAGQQFVPYDRNNDCASGDGMHMIYDWGNDDAVVKGRLETITHTVARNFVSRMLKRNPEERPSVATLLQDDFFKLTGANAEMKDDLTKIQEELKKQGKEQKRQGQEQERQGQEQERQGQEQKRQGKLLEVIKDLSQENQDEIRHSCEVLMKGIFEAAQVTTPTTFVILREKLEDPSTEEKEAIAAFDFAVDDNGVTVKNKFVSCQLTEDGPKVTLNGKLKAHQERFKEGMDWVEDIKDIGFNLAADKVGAVGDAFKIIKKGLSKAMTETEKSMYLYLVDELTGEPVRAEEWPIEITKPSEWVHKMVPLMQLGMRAMSVYNGAAGVARMFGCLLPKVPKEFSKGASDSIALLQMESSVQEFSVVHDESMQGSEEEKSVRGQSLREFKDFLKKYDPKLKKNDGSEGDFAGLQLLGDPNDGTAIWTTLTDKDEIEKKLNERREQRQEQEEVREQEKTTRKALISRSARKVEDRRQQADPLPSQEAMRQPSSGLASSPADPLTTDNVATGKPVSPPSQEAIKQPSSSLTSSLADPLTTENVATGKIHIAIEIVKGNGFKAKRKTFGKLNVPHVYCKVKYGPSEWQTHHVKDDSSPVWSAQRVFEYDPNEVVEIDVFDRNKKGNDDYYGRARSAVSDILNANNGSLILEVKEHKSPNGGTNRWSDGIFITIKCQKLL